MRLWNVCKAMYDWIYTYAHPFAILFRREALVTRLRTLYYGRLAGV